jgi:hypothetical protein
VVKRYLTELRVARRRSGSSDNLDG